MFACPGGQTAYGKPPVSLLGSLEATSEGTFEASQLTAQDTVFPSTASVG